jgi:hypothetical protein
VEVGGVTAGLDVLPDAAVVTGAVVEGDAAEWVAADLEAAAGVSQLGFEGGGEQQ